MKTIISNKIRVYDASMDLYWWCKDNLTIVNPDWQTLMRIGKEDMVRSRHVPESLQLFVESGSDLILPFGVLRAIWPFIKDSPYEIKFNDNGEVIDQNQTIATPLYDYQEEAVEKMLFVKGGILKSSAGSGKTQIGIEVAKRIGRNTLWICGKTDLLNQTVDRIHYLYPNIPVGTITNGEVKMVNNGITVSTVQTLVDVDPEIYRGVFDTIIVDECHRCVSAPTKMRMFGKVMERIAARYKYGLTATTTRADTMVKSMYAIIGVNEEGEFAPIFTIEKDKTKTLTAKHIKFDLDTAWTYDCLNEDGTFNYMALIDYLGHNKQRNEAIVNNVVKVLETHKKQLVLCSRIEHCETINNMLLERGVKSVLLVGKVSKKKRKEILTGQEDYNVIVGTISLVKEGLDMPELSCLHWAMIVGDEVATIQSAGRIERVCEGKPEPEIYDYVDVNFPYCVGKYKKRIRWLKKR